MASRILQLDTRDNVLIALGDLKKGEEVCFSGESYVLASDVAAKHKLATREMAAGESVVMYGVIVGKTVGPIARGEAITTRNLRHDAAPFEERGVVFHWRAPDVTKWKAKTFQGYARRDGQVGTRNYWVVIPLVFCENRNIGVLKQAFEEELGFAAPQIGFNYLGRFAAPGATDWGEAEDALTLGAARYHCTDDRVPADLNTVLDPYLLLDFPQ